MSHTPAKILICKLCSAELSISCELCLLGLIGHSVHAAELRLHELRKHQVVHLCETRFGSLSKTGTLIVLNQPFAAAHHNTDETIMSPENTESLEVV